MTLVIMAAGMGSRYGGLKQLDPITEHGEFIIDFSIYDAIRAGFDKVVFIIKKENYEAFKETVGNRIEGNIKVEYAFQELDALPEGITVPEGRVKPWGTAHAVLCASDKIDGNFAVINADDFYGYDAFKKIYDFYQTEESCACGKAHFAMSGYVLKNTLTENGHVSRGICSCDENEKLTSIVERTKIMRLEDGRVAYGDDGEWVELDEESVASMNCWGFTPAILDHIKSGIVEFFKSPKFDPLKGEYYLPSAVTEMMNADTCDVKLLRTSAKWYGVTYHEDKEYVVSQIKKMVQDGIYPNGLWK